MADQRTCDLIADELDAALATPQAQPNRDVLALVDEMDAEFIRIAKLPRSEKERYKMPMLTVFTWLEKLKDALAAAPVAADEKR